MSGRTFDIAVIQLTPKKGKVEGNDATLRAAFAQLAAEPPKLIVLPESALTGYFLEGATFECAKTQEEFAQFLSDAWTSQSQATVEIICGFYEIDEGVLYNSSISVRVSAGAHRILHVHRKLFLPTYGVFDEARFITRGRELRTYDGAAGNTGIAICEDFWHGLTPTILALKGARLMVVPSASPGRGVEGPTIGSVAYWEELLRLVASEHGVFIVYAGLTGFEGGKAMTGSSCIIDPFGRILGSALAFEPAILRVRLDLDDVLVARASYPLIGDLAEIGPELLRDIETQSAIWGKNAVHE
jgi:N-carbamoylputrescine amidase